MKLKSSAGHLARIVYNAARAPFSRSAEVPESFRVVAFLPVYNEADVIEATLRRLAQSGVQVYVLDNWSTDGTWELVHKNASGNLIGAERNPSDGPSRSYDLQRASDRIVALVSKIRPDWALWHDADEYFQGPWPSLPLRAALHRADQQRYNAISFRWITFPPVDNSFQPGADFVGHFRHWTAYYVAHRCAWVRAWKGTAENVSFFGGSHEARFAGRYVHPIPFVIRHYPVRSQQHGQTKIFRERRPRYSAAGLGRGWHVQYRRLAEGQSLLEDASNLHRLDEATFLTQVRQHRSPAGCPLCLQYGATARSM